ncbi:ABC transporter permease [Chelativorans sp. Marseille-P2723]|uniref:ABC transporter permease n=1 Tax=Chelativorans sp. Marseille-P2723 TaxID=2709133 RepID=UPI00156E480C|nr:ABC transporter permease [Chelativorans sp. Marseille-P2723]
MADALLNAAQRHRWIWPALGVLLLWAALTVLTARFSLHSLSGVAMSASFLLMPALGQMLVITTGRGNIDLSIPSVITVSAYVTVVTASSGMNGFWLPLFLVIVIAVGVGLFNAMLLLVLRIPAMIATLATGYILATATLLVNARVSIFPRPPVLIWLATGRIGGLPVICLIALTVAAVVGIVLARTAFGKQLSAVGQNIVAARYAGVQTARLIASAFVASSLLASLTGMLLAAYAGGAFLEMGAPYLLQSVGAVVLGGTLIAGGSASVLGTFFGSFLLILIVTTMQIAGLPAGAQDILQGLVIIGVLSIAGGKLRSRRD